MRTIDKIITPCNCEYGAPMGRPNVGEFPRICIGGVSVAQMMRRAKKVFDCKVPLSSDGAYDRGGAYWGIGSELRVQYTKDLTYIKFYRIV